MIADLIAPLRRVVNTLVANHSPHELAAGFTLGMIIGLLPKGNLIALSLCVVLFSLRVNKGLGLISAVLFACLATSIDPFVHKVGLIALGLPALQISFASLYNMPLGPWLGFNNTVTSGGLIVGLYVAYPVYYVARVTATRIERQLATWRGEMSDMPWLSDDDNISTRKAA